MTKQKRTPPKLAEWMLSKWACTFEKTSLLGDFEEEYFKKIVDDSPSQAAFWYWMQVVISIPSFLKNSIYWSLIMFRNYLKIAFRTFRKHKSYSFINIVGLAIGITCSVLMLLWVQDELSFDRFHTNAKEISRILLDPQEAATTHEAVSPPILAGKMKAEIPEVTNSVRLTPHGRMLFTYQDKTFYENQGMLADLAFFEMFDFPFIQGTADTAFKDLRSLVITENLALKYFGSENPIGKTITLNNITDYTVSGVIKDVPANSHLQFNYVRSFELFSSSGRDMNNWGDVSYYTYVLLQKGSSIENVNIKLKAMIEKEDPAHNLYYLQPLTQIHLHSKFNFDIGGHGNVMYVYIFTAASLFVLLIACINFMNLATARSGIRAKEIGMRKVVGAKKSDIIKQFYSESILSSLFALALAVNLVLLLLPAFNNLSGKELTFGLLENTQFLLGLLAIAIFTGLLSGSYPALFLSAFHPIRVLRGTLKSGARGSLFRKILVTTQFSLTIVLIIGTLVINKQLSHIRGIGLGYDKDQIVVLPLRGIEAENFKTIKNELIQNPWVVNVTTTSSLPTFIGSGTSGADWAGKDPETRIQMQINWVDTDYLSTFKMEMADGRFFSKEFTTDETNVVLNEAAIKAMGIESPLGKRFNWNGDRQIIGVIKDFHYKSLHTEIEPLILIAEPGRVDYACMRINTVSIPETIRFIENTWKNFAPNFPFEYSFLDERLDNLYRAEQRMAHVFKYFTLLGMFIACLGLFGMASFTAEQRTKEIGIRKILGASVPNVVSLLSREFTKLVLISNIIAWPIAYLVMNWWLQSFAYRTNIGIWIFFGSAVLALVIAFITVSYQSVKAALTNPAESLHYE
ncbi:ABC transporter permease [Acidobacteriota bacterium]